MKKNTKKVNQLTSLRFFASLMILIHHNLFNINQHGLEFAQGVSLFFILSGFILTYVYSSLDNWDNIKQFWKARIARIWPAYFTSFLLGFWLMPYSWNNKIVTAHLLMTQSWIPLPHYYFSYNAVNWSVSTELFFYLSFPFLLHKWKDTWKIKFIFSASIVILLIIISNTYALEKNGNFGMHGILYIHPVTRIFEFIFGMCLALASKNYQLTCPFIPVISMIKMTCYELISIFLCALSMCYTGKISLFVQNTILGEATAYWIKYSGSMFAFGLLIYILAQGRGLISKLLSTPILVLLGELSFSLYLIHQILFLYYQASIAKYTPIYVSRPVADCIFLCILLLLSYCIWKYIEMPVKQFILHFNKQHLIARYQAYGEKARKNFSGSPKLESKS